MSVAWNQATLEETCNITYGERVIKKRDAGTAFPVYGGGGETFRIDRFNREDCTIVSRFGMSAFCVRNVAGKFFLNDSGLSVHPKNPAKLFPRFLDYFLYASQRKIYSLGRGSAQKNLDVKAFRRLEISYPGSLPEQKRIVAILDETFSGIDTAIANTEKNLANARELFESYLNSVFSQRGEGWADKPLKDVCEFSSGGTPSKKNSSYWDGEIPWVSGRDMKSMQLFDSKLHVSKAAVDGSATRLAAKGSLLVLVRGMGLAHGAQIAELMAPCTFNQDIKEIRPNPDLMPRYLVFMLRHQINSSSNVLSSAAHGTLKINTEAMKALRIFIPPHEQQEQIITKIDALKEGTERLEAIYQQKLTALAELKQSLLQKAFSGELTADNVVPITSATTSSATPATTSPVFAAHIMAAAYHWHESRGKNKTFGHVKAQKTLHLVEAVAQIDLGRVPVKDAAGPNDFAHMRTAETWARENDFYQFVPRAEGPRGYDFVKGKRYNEWLSQALDALEPYKSPLDRVVSLLMPLDTQKAELVATAYAAWNNLLLDGHKPSEEDIVHEARDNWHRDKQQYTESQFREAIARLRDHGMVPTGTGKRVTGQESLEL